VNILQAIAQAHAFYCHLTGQRVSLLYNRERMWCEFLNAGYTQEDLRRVILYLQREIREGRRNVGALKLSNLLQLDRFEEDFNISRVVLHAPKIQKSPSQQPSTQVSQEEDQAAHRRAAQILAKFRAEHSF
jgi:hypothetical protein